MPLAALLLFEKGEGIKSCGQNGGRPTCEVYGAVMAFDITDIQEKRLLVIEHWESAANEVVVEASIKMGARVVEPVFRRILIDVPKAWSNSIWTLWSRIIETSWR